MRIIPIATLAAALIVSMPATAQGNSQAAAAAATASAGQAAKASSEEKKICKRIETSGTRMWERVCLTKEEWKKVEELD
jgi:hypothetical protein